ncbi:serine/threonine protein kinase [Streptosporangium sp. NPDC087985]|uniref:serine/threonine protein kinase n=1 Tax=Streptosporangium sp. NPDC087985 TaxID=3366196 RepID=UPI00380BE487
MLPLLMGDPREIGSYRVVGRLGAGGMGVVYAGVDAAGRRVAVKLVHEPLSVDLEFRRRFSREISVLGEVGGACVAKVLGSDAGTERPWLATEYIAGPTLEQHLRAEGPLTGDALYGLAAGVAEALVSMHAAGVVHRDLKPSNVILSPDGPRLIDFGIAKVLDGSTMTHTGTLIGSPGWISPEEYGDGPSGTPADVYGWALLVLFAVTGEPPYGTGRPEVLAYRVREEMPETSAIPEELRESVGRALAKEPAERPAAAEVLAAVTDAWQGREGEERGIDVTSLIQRTWVLSRGETPDWPEAAGPVTVAADRVKTETATALMVEGTARRPGPTWVHAYIATAVAVTLIAVTAIVMFAPVSPFSGRSSQIVVAQTTPTGTPAPAATPVPSVGMSSPAPAVSVKARKVSRVKGKAVSVQGIRMTLPKGWRLLRVHSDYVCVESPNSRGASGPWDFFCRPDAMAIDLRSGANGWPGRSIDSDYGFMIGQGTPCLAGGSVTRDPDGGYNEAGEYGLYAGVLPYNSRLNRSSLARMADGRKAAYREWLVRCDGYGEYVMKIWHLPASKVSFYVLSARPEDAGGYRQIIASADLTGYRYAAPL